MPEIPESVEQYLDQLRRELAGCDVALVEDALRDAEEYLRSEQERLPGEQRASGFAAIVERYGTPREVAEAHRETARPAEAPPEPERRQARGVVGTFLGALIDPRAYTSFVYMLLSLGTGILYFTWVVTGLSLSLGLMILIIGIPFFLLFVATVRVLSFVEGRVIEALLGVRMPRRPPVTGSRGSLAERALGMLTDWRTWSTMIYMAVKLPLGVLSFTVFVTLTAVSVGLLLYPLGQWAWPQPIIITDDFVVEVPVAGYPLVSLVGFLGLVLTLNLARWAGALQGLFAKEMLVKA